MARSQSPVFASDDVFYASYHCYDHDVCSSSDAASATESYMPFVLPIGSDEGITMIPLPGIRCPTCAKDGKEVWVIPGRACGYCGTECM